MILSANEKNVFSFATSKHLAHYLSWKAAEKQKSNAKNELARAISVSFRDIPEVFLFGTVLVAVYGSGPCLSMRDADVISLFWLVKKNTTRIVCSQISENLELAVSTSDGRIELFALDSRKQINEQCVVQRKFSEPAIALQFALLD